MRPLLICGLALLIASHVSAQAPKVVPAKATPPDAAAIKAITDKTSELGKAIQTLASKGVADAWIADVEIFHNAAVNIVEFGEFYNKDSAAWTMEILDQGLARAKSLTDNKAPWAMAPGKTVVRGFRSRVDGTAQPYAVAFPESFGKEKKPWRTDVVLHGRDGTYTEVKFLRSHNEKKAEANAFARIDIAGRGNNAYRWAGETDVFEALDHCFANDTTRLLDLRRVIIRGFSMGGAGTWHLGLHHPGQWCAMSPGAGFTTTHGYISGLANPLPPHQEACLKIYDAVNYVENGFNVPIVAYSGGKDGQKLAADNIEARAKTLGIPMVHLIAPDEAHRFPPEYVKKAEVHWSDHGAKGRPAYAKEVRLTTYTLKYNQCDWVEILGLEKHYEKAEARAKWKSDGYEVTTTNVQSLHLMMEPGVSDKRVVDINGQKLTATPWINDVGIANLFLRKSEGDGKWEAVWPQRIMVAQQQQPRKIRGLQGPIDDAFADAFVCVRGTGKPWNENVRKYADADLARFQREWAKHMRGRLIVKDDVQLTNDDIGLRHLVLFGDPASNSVLAQVVDALPLQWSAKEIRFAGKTVSAADHVPVMIQPNPLNPLRYVVVNSGHTFHHAEFNGTNAQLYPRLGDFALLKITPTLKDALGVELVVAGLFDEYWRMPK